MDRTEQYARHSLNRVAFSATVHCLSGCAVGQLLGLMLGSAMHLSVPATITLCAVLAFLSGYSLTMTPLLRGGTAFAAAARLAWAADTLTIAVMEIVDNTVMLLIPGAMKAGPGASLFWGSVPTSLVIAGIVAFPVGRQLISRGRGHAVVQRHLAAGVGPRDRHL